MDVINDRKQRAEEEQKRRDDRDKENIREVCSTPKGKRFLWDLMSDCHVFHSSFGASNDHTNFNEGKRDIGLGILNLILNACPQRFQEMQREFKAEKVNQEIQKDKQKEEERII